MCPQPAWLWVFFDEYGRHEILHKWPAKPQTGAETLSDDLSSNNRCGRFLQPSLLHWRDEATDSAR